MKRKIYEKLLEWKNNNINKPLMVIGARQVGKTYIIQKFCNKEFKEYIYINLLEYQDIIEIFSRKISIVDKIELLKIIIKYKQNIYFDT
ncbi:MAG: AAA family ATPase [Bacilli bacterium]|nr:AAA family ATPase [Bacilli bacterium]